MSLRITLRDGEKVVVNGAVLRSVGRTDLCVEHRVAILRGRDVMSPEDATTPAKLLYFHCMMAYIDPEDRERHQDRVIHTLQDVALNLPVPDAHDLCVSFARELALSRYYQALGECKKLIELEARLLAEAGAQAA